MQNVRSRSVKEDGDEGYIQSRYTNCDSCVIHKTFRLEFMKLFQYSGSSSSAILLSVSYTDSFPSGQTFPVLPVTGSFLFSIFNHSHLHPPSSSAF